MQRLEQAICNAQSLLDLLSTVVCREQEYGGNSPDGGDAASGTNQLVGDAKSELHAAFHDFHEAWRIAH